MDIRVSHDDFDPAAEIARLQQRGKDGFPGAVVTFTGLVRDMAEDITEDKKGGSPITAMTLEHYPAMTEAALTRIRAEAMQRWPLTRAVIIHRIGRLLAGDQIVFVGCASPHRDAAFEAARYMMDFLKTYAPFWKAEERDGEITWVDARDTDHAARKRWQQD